MLKPNRKLDALNFALAGAREGFGPFLGVYLQAKGFNPATTGVAMSLAGAAGLVVTTPIGALIDGIEAKRTGIILAVSAIAIGAIVIMAARSGWLIGAAQLLIGVGDTSVAPLLAAVTLGIVGATLSPLVAGSAAQRFGYSFAFVGLGVVALFGSLYGHSEGAS